MMNDNINDLKKLSMGLLNEAVNKIQFQRSNSSNKEKYFIISEFLLTEAKEYAEGSFDMIASGKYKASLSLSRWILETSLNLFWVTADKNEIDNRLNAWGAESLRCEVNLREGMAKLWPTLTKICKENAEKAKKEKEILSNNKLEPLDSRLKNIMIDDKSKEIYEKLYPLYRICCSSAHPNLKLWEKYNTSGEKIDKSADKFGISCWMVTSSIFYLAIFSYRLTELGDYQELKDYWEKISKLLNV